MLFRKYNTYFYKKHTKPLNTTCGRHKELSNVSARALKEQLVVSQRMKIIFGARALQHFPFVIRSKCSSNYSLATAFPGSTSLVQEQS